MGKSSKVLAWHFLEKPSLPHGDKRAVIIGETLSVEPPIVICKHGLHGSKRIRDALQYAPGNILCRTEHSGIIQEREDKICSQHRKVLWMGNIEAVLNEFACAEAERALADRRKEGYTIPEECDQAIQAKRLFLQGKITGQKLATARSAAESAAWSAVWSAARSAAWSAARSAAESAAWSAAESAQNDRLTAAVEEYMKNNP